MKAKLLYSLIISLITMNAFGQTQEGKASYYADKFEGRSTASGEKYRHSKLTAAHKTLPFGTVVKVTNVKNGKSVVVRINDRGPYVDGRIIDLSKSAAEKIDLIHAGIADVKIQIIDAGDGKGSGPIKPIESTPVEEKEFYDFSVNRIKPNGFGVQIGSFRELANLVRLSENLKSSYQKEVTVQVKLIKDIKVYTIVVGNFKNREKATDFKLKLKNRYPDAFIVDFNTL